MSLQSCGNIITTKACLFDSDRVLFGEDVDEMLDLGRFEAVLRQESHNARIVILHLFIILSGECQHMCPLEDNSGLLDRNHRPTTT